MTDPRLHTHVERCLPDGHPLARQQFGCEAGCGKLLHAGNNECMTTWVETGRGNYCLGCFAALDGTAALDDEWGLPEYPGIDRRRH